FRPIVATTEFSPPVKPRLNSRAATIGTPTTSTISRIGGSARKKPRVERCSAVRSRRATLVVFAATSLAIATCRPSGTGPGSSRPLLRHPLGPEPVQVFVHLGEVRQPQVVGVRVGEHLLHVLGQLVQLDHRVAGDAA